MNRANPIRERFLTLFHENKDRLYDFALRTLSSRDAAEDITQQAFVRLFNTLSRNSSITDGRSWLFITTRNLCYNHIRDRQKEVPLDHLNDSEMTIPPFSNPEHMRLQKALGQLDTPYREALILKEYEGFSYYEIAKILNTTVPAVRTVLYKARLKLKSNYEKIKTMRL